MRPWTQHQKGIVIAIFAAIFFAFYPSTLRGAYANGCNAVTALLATTWMRGLCMAFYCRLKKLPVFSLHQNTKQVLTGGLVQAISLTGIILALLYIPGPLVIIIVFSHTIMLLFYMAWRGEIKLDRVNILTTAIALIGLTLVLDIWHSQTNTHWLGVALAFAAALATVSRLYIFGHQMKKRHPIAVGAENYLIAGFLILPALLFQTPALPGTMTGYIYLAAGCISMTVATFLMFPGIALLGSFQYSLLLKLEPALAAVFSLLILHEILGWTQYLGIGIVLSSLIAYQLLQQRKARLADPS